jgi:hypothetical protein
MIIGKLVFGKDGLNHGLELCLSKAGLTAHPVTEATASGCDILLVSMFWYRNVYELELFLRNSGIKKGSGRPWIIAGGMQATMTPEIVSEFVDFVFIGDGDDHLGAVVKEVSETGQCTHPHIYRSSDASVPDPAMCAPSAYMIRTNDDAGTLRCEIARGCKFKCAFCCIANLKPYREVSFADLEDSIKKASGKRCSFFAPERACHSEWSKIKAALKKHNCHDMGQDARLEHLGEIDGGMVTFGLEGISEKLRRSIGKPFSDQMVMDRLGEFVSTRKNIARVSIYFIANLPGEDESDWENIWELFGRIGKEEWSRRLVLCPVLNPLSPKPFTRLKEAEIDIFAPYGDKWSRLLRRDGGQWGYRIVETLVWGPLERTMDAIVQRGKTSGARVIKRLSSKILKGMPPSKDRVPTAKAILGICANEGIHLDYLEGRRKDIA